ncbi:MAG: sigma-54 dependent transcriptional regulator [Desulfatitalea sp.]
MKNPSFHINLYVIIPLIFSGFTILGLLVAYRLTSYYLVHALPPQWPLAFWGMVLTLFTFGCGLLVVRFLIQPVENFVDKTQTMGVLGDAEAHGKPPAAAGDEMHRYSRVFDQVTEILGKVEARELFPDIVGQSTPMRAVFNQIVKVAPTDATVLIIGETGTGKELVAHGIHRHSPRRDKSFLAMNCAAIPEGLLESELFGHEKGAFTGAVSRKLGKMELAHEGTLFLDEIGDMPLETQAKVLRALEEKSIERLGGTQAIRVNTRFIAATNKNLPDLVKKGAFRQDLFFRLNVFVIQLPPIRERREDIPLLADHYLSGLAPSKKLTSTSIQKLMAHDWPGNVRELQNAIQSAAVMANETIEPAHLPSSITTQSWPQSSTEEPLGNMQDLDIDSRLQDLEKNMLIQALSQCRGVQKQAARMLGIKERSLWHRLKKFDIDAASYKN